MIKITRYYAEFPDNSGTMCLVKKESKGNVSWFFTRDKNEPVRKVSKKEVTQMVEAGWFLPRTLE